MGVNPKALEFAQWLRGQMAEHGFSQRELGKRLDPDDRERGRRQVIRHLSGKHYPSAASRRSYAAILGEEFVDRDEEPRQVSLLDELNAVVREHRATGRRLERLLAKGQA